MPGPKKRLADIAYIPDNSFLVQPNDAVVVQGDGIQTPYRVINRDSRSKSQLNQAAARRRSMTRAEKTAELIGGALPILPAGVMASSAVPLVAGNSFGQAVLNSMLGGKLVDLGANVVSRGKSKNFVDLLGRGIKDFTGYDPRQNAAVTLGLEMFNPGYYLSPNNVVKASSKVANAVNKAISNNQKLYAIAPGMRRPIGTDNAFANLDEMQLEYLMDRGGDVEYLTNHGANTDFLRNIINRRNGSVSRATNSASSVAQTPEPYSRIDDLNYMIDGIRRGEFTLDQLRTATVNGRPIHPDDIASLEQVFNKQQIATPANVVSSQVTSVQPITTFPRISLNDINRYKALKPDDDSALETFENYNKLVDAIERGDYNAVRQGFENDYISRYELGTALEELGYSYSNDYTSLLDNTSEVLGAFGPDRYSIRRNVLSDGSMSIANRLGLTVPGRFNPNSTWSEVIKDYGYTDTNNILDRASYERLQNLIRHPSIPNDVREKLIEKMDNYENLAREAYDKGLATYQTPVGEIGYGSHSNGDVHDMTFFDVDWAMDFAKDPRTDRYQSFAKRLRQTLGHEPTDEQVQNAIIGAAKRESASKIYNTFRNMAIGQRFRMGHNGSRSADSFSNSVVNETKYIREGRAKGEFELDGNGAVVYSRDNKMAKLRRLQNPDGSVNRKNVDKLNKLIADYAKEINWGGEVPKVKMIGNYFYFPNEITTKIKQKLGGTINRKHLFNMQR